MIQLSDLPLVNASLNATSGVFLVAGYLCIRRQKITAHAVCMIVALTVSILFLGTYVTYHALAGVKHYQGTGWTRPVYFTILTTHTFLAILVALVLAPITVIRAARRRFDKHKAIARLTLPIWLYVSVTGVVVYLMLYK